MQTRPEPRPTNTTAVRSQSPMQLRTRSGRSPLPRRQELPSGGRRPPSPLLRGRGRSAGPSGRDLRERSLTSGSMTHFLVPTPPRGPRLALLPLVVVIACSFLPAVAMGDSANEQYTEPLPSASGSNTAIQPGGAASAPNDPTSGGSAAPAGGSTTPDSGGSTAPGASGGTSPSSGSGQNGGPSVQGSGGGTGPAVATEAAPQATQSGSPAASTSDDGGSSALAPILLGILLVAALSVGFVVMRGRRNSAGGGGSASRPELG